MRRRGHARRRVRSLRRRYGRSRVLVHNLDEVYDALDGRQVTYRGIPWRIKARMSQGASSRQPYSRIELEATAATKRNPLYQQEKRQLRDDFSVDVTDSDEFWSTVVPKFVDDSGIGR